MCLVLAGCGQATDPTVGAPSAPATDPPTGTATATPSTGEQQFPEVLAVEPTRVDGDVWSFDVTLSSPYDSPERYADGWRVLGPDGTVLGEQALTHDHAGEQPFTRTQPRVRIPAEVGEVTVEGHDTANGYGGIPMTVTLPG